MEPGTTEDPTAITNITGIIVAPHIFSTVWYHVFWNYAFMVVVVTTVTHPCHYTGRISTHHSFTNKDNVKAQHTTALHVYDCHLQET